MHKFIGYVAYKQHPHITEFTNTYGDIDGPFYDSMISMYGKVTDACDKDEELFHTLNDRLYDVVEKTEGFHQLVN